MNERHGRKKQHEEKKKEPKIQRVSHAWGLRSEQPLFGILQAQNGDNQKHSTSFMYEFKYRVQLWGHNGLGGEEGRRGEGGGGRLGPGSEGEGDARRPRDMSKARERLTAIINHS
ncbi:hypothetical protein GWI33_011927 [Rhynchophorus ferrugineus]|uniref:Uncharacterized protein n=1 Tax=Rhynchophorus ferrugineus TaxID=354439 RepID=A0A834MJU0_RHYFE|nr:hypothetical protein GWI33_011927 [Rhynchophorus ferrugineus]